MLLDEPTPKQPPTTVSLTMGLTLWVVLSVAAFYGQPEGLIGQIWRALTLGAGVFMGLLFIRALVRRIRVRHS
jgi:hypothetical protein